MSISADKLHLLDFSDLDRALAEMGRPALSAIQPLAYALAM